MKKMLSLLLSSTLLLSTPITVFAEGDSHEGTQTVSTTVPNPTWTLSIPANTTVEYNVTRTELTMPTVKNPENCPADRDVDVYINHTGQFDGEGSVSGQYISFTIKAKYGDNENSIASGKKVLIKNYVINNTGAYEQYGAEKLYLDIQSFDWRTANPGTYSTTITYSSAMQS